MEQPNASLYERMWAIVERINNRSYANGGPTIVSKGDTFFNQVAAAKDYLGLSFRKDEFTMNIINSLEARLDEWEEIYKKFHPIASLPFTVRPEKAPSPREMTNVRTGEKFKVMPPTNRIRGILADLASPGTIDKTVYGELQFKPDPQSPHVCTEQCERLAAEALQAMDASQPRWIEAPTNYRCYVVPQHIFITDYDRLDENGNPCPEGVMMALIVRKRDGKRFKPASWIPAQIEHDVFVRNMERVYYLEEA